MGAVVAIGVDVGQRVDPTAIAVVERDDRPVYEPDDTERSMPVKHECHHAVRHLERLKLGTEYPEVAKAIAAIAAGVKGLTKANPVVYVDATGVGQPVVDMLRSDGLRSSLVPVYFTHGDRRTVEKDGTIKLGKAWLVSRLQTLLQHGRLHILGTPEARALAKELLDYEIKIDQDANDRYGAFKVGSHDDLVTAVGLATQTDYPQNWGVVQHMRRELDAMRRPANGMPAGAVVRHLSDAIGHGRART